MIKKNKILLFSALGALVLLLAWLAFKNLRTPTEKPHRGPIQEAVYGLGTVKSNRIFEQKQGVISRIREVFVHEGQQVEQGAPLIQFDDGGPVRAPFSGTVTLLPFHVGENVFPQIVILRIEDLQDRMIEMNLEQQASLRMKKGLIAKLSFESIRGQMFEGEVDSIYPSNGQFIVRVVTKNLPPEILPGMTVDVAVEIQKKENALLIPANAVTNGKVTVLQNRQKKKVEVQLGLTDGEWIEVLGGDLKDDDTVVISGK